MKELFHTFWLCFVPLFVAVDALGVLPMFMALTDGMPGPDVRRILRQSVVTAAVVAIAFLAGGQALLSLLGITVNDFMVAGGTLVFALSMSDMLRAEKTQRSVDPDSVGAVPIGVPLITGPAVLTTSLLLLNTHGPWFTGASLVCNILLAGVVFHFAQPIHRVLGKPGSRTVSKIASLLLASIAVMMVRKGLIALLR